MSKLKLVVTLIVFVIVAWVGQLSQAQSALFVQITPGELQQGRTALIRVTANRDITRVEVLFNGRQSPLYLSVDGDWVGFLPADINSERGALPVQVFSWRGEEANPPQVETINVVWGSFFYQDIGIPNSLAHLLDPALNKSEEDTVIAAYNRLTDQKWWNGPFQMPVPGGQISEFGGIRTYNDGVLESRHTGADFRAGLGEPIYAAGDGRVVFASFLDIRGNHVIVDHGMGVLTGYSHMSEIYVVPGQRVLAGDVLGAVGSTGRVQGAHFHFEISVDGSWVDPIQFMSLEIPDAVVTVDMGG